jgi:CubicO group peptidase (beta-lactamase class C family)
VERPSYRFGRVDREINPSAADGWPLYGYLWWVADETIIGGRAMSWIFGQGFGGQRIYIVPADDLVVVIMAGRYTSDSEARVAIFDHYVLDAIRP